MSARFAAVDLGASSGRVVVGEVGTDTLYLQTVTRFPNGPVRHDDGLHWDVDALLQCALGGLAAACATGPVTSLGIDAWGVDYGLVAGGTLAAEPFCYRDERRNAVGPERVAALIDAPELFGRNGLQHLSFNTLYQLAADDVVARAERMLLIPDLVAWSITGQMRSERTNASTTGLLDVTTGSWDLDLMARLGLDQGLLSPLVDPGEEIGLLDRPFCDVMGQRLPVVAVASHDTASAVVGTPLLADDAAYVSLGTWALAGLELDAPVLSEAARAANFTNEGGADGTIRFLTNVMGTWMLSETLRAWGETDLAGLLREAEAHEGEVPLIDVQDARFVPPNDRPGGMASRIDAWCDEHEVARPDGRPAVVRCIVLSIAAAVATALERAGSLAGRRVGSVHVVGGGAQNSLLCQAIADRSGRPVLAGPVEATAIGNVLVQARTAGAVGPTLADLRALVARTQVLARYEPRC